MVTVLKYKWIFRKNSSLQNLFCLKQPPKFSFAVLSRVKQKSPSLEESFQGVRHTEKAPAFGVRQTWIWIPAVTGSVILSNSLTIYLSIKVKYIL